MSDVNSVCVVCQEVSSLKCGRCRNVAYCSKEHQKVDWIVHKKVCTSAARECFEIAEDEKLGRHLVAARSILKGEIIVEEVPLVKGPLQETQPVCLGCFKLLNKNNSQNCSQCGWPVCSIACEKSSLHKPECEITTKYRKEKVTIRTFDINHPSYQCLTTLRCLYLKNHSPKKWEKIMNLESHSKKIKTSEKYEKDVAMVAKFIPRFFNYNEFTEEEILKVVGIIEVNAHHVPFELPGYITVYDKASMLEHNCRANCSKTFTECGGIVIRAGRAIKKGEHLSISYMEALWGRQARQDYLLTSKYFACECERCADPTELGTHFNSYKCLQPECQGYFVVQKIAPKQQYLCTTCGVMYTYESLKDSFDEIGDGMSKLNVSDPESCKNFLSVFEKYLHPNHYLMVEVKLALIVCYENDKLTCASVEDLEYMIRILKSLISLTSRLIPAENRIRGVLYFRLHSVYVEQNNRKSLCGELNGSEIRQQLLVARDVLEKAYSFLKHEPETFSEGKMAVEALMYIQDIDKILGRIQLHQ